MNWNGNHHPPNKKITTFTLSTTLIRIWQAKLHHANNCWFFSVCSRTFVTCVVSVQPPPASYTLLRQAAPNPAKCLPCREPLRHSIFGSRVWQLENHRTRIWVLPGKWQNGTSFLSLTRVSFAYISKRLSYNTSSIASGAINKWINCFIGSFFQSELGHKIEWILEYGHINGHMINFAQP